MINVRSDNIDFHDFWCMQWYDSFITAKWILWLLLKVDSYVLEHVRYDKCNVKVASSSKKIKFMKIGKGMINLQAIINTCCCTGEMDDRRKIGPVSHSNVISISSADLTKLRNRKSIGVRLRCHCYRPVNFCRLVFEKIYFPLRQWLHQLEAMLTFHLPPYTDLSIVRVWI